MGVWGFCLSSYMELVMPVVATENGGQRVIEFAGGTVELGSPPILKCLLSCKRHQKY